VSKVAMGSGVEGMDKRLLSRSEVARLFEVSPATVARWARQGKLPYCLTLGGRRRFLRKEILAILQAITRGSEEPEDRIE